MSRARVSDFATHSDRAATLFGLGAALLVALLFRVAYLQSFRREHFAGIAAAQRSRTEVIVPRRGDVSDRNGALLAMTQDISRVAFDPKRLWKSEETERIDDAKLAEASRVLGSLLGLTAEKVALSISSRKLRKGEHKRYRIIKEDATPAEVAAVRYFSATEPYDAFLAGAVPHVVSSRLYAGGDSSAALIGVTVPGPCGTSVGSGGIERWANTALAGSIGWIQARVDRRGVPIPTSAQRIVSAADGANVRLTIDLNVQRICAVALAQCMKEHTPLGATAIVLDPTTGDILGMVSRPSVDPNDRTEKSSIPEGLRNRALLMWEPGSVMKPITLCIASAEGLISPSEVFPCPGYRMLDGKRIGCEAHRSSTPAPGTNTPRMVIAKSCNTATSLIANRIGGTRLGAGMERFGLLAPTGVQLLGDRAGWLEARKPASDQSRGAVARIGFGQSVMISPLALTAAFGAIVNRGVLMRPRIVQALTDQANRVIQEFPVEEAGRAVPREVADTMVTYLQAAVTEGTGKLARLDGFTTGGKTGTASKVKGDTYSEHVASFIGYVQAGERRIVIAVVVDEPKNGYHGGQAAAPTFRRIAKELVLHWHVAPDKSGPPTKVARADGGTPND